MEFNPNNNIIKHCVQGMWLDANNNHEEAMMLFQRSWDEAVDDFEKFIAAYYLGLHQKKPTDKIIWFEKALMFALKYNNDLLKSSIPHLYFNIAKCCEELGDDAKAKHNYELAASFDDTPADTGPFYHGTKADLKIGDHLIAGGSSNYKPGLKMNHIYFTALADGAGLAAALAQGDKVERVYIVEPTGSFENDPNVTNKKFPGNLTRSYRSQMPLKIIGEIKSWKKQSTGELEKWRQNLAKNKGDIIN